MVTFVLSFVFFSLAIAGLAVGLLAGRAGVRGTCGGLNRPDGGCGLCKGECHE